MAHKIQVKRGNKADLPTLNAGEFGLCQDTNELFIGNSGNQKIFPPTAPTISDVEGLQTALDGKVDDSQVLTNVPANAEFTDTVTTINGKTGAIAKADIVALGIPAQDTVYEHPSTHSADIITDGTTNKTFTAILKSAYDGLVTLFSGITSVVTTLGADNTSIPTSKAVADAISGAGGGDMMKATYDPSNIGANVFSADNHVDGTTNKVFTATEKTKLGTVDENANEYVHPTTAGNKHIPTGGTVGQVILNSASGTGVWGNETKKRTARFVIGTSTAGWTAADCDYLCAGTADDVEINAAITALPATGGEIVILDGTYNITAKINVTKNNISIRGNGNATILKRMFDSSVREGVITLTSGSGCKIANLQVDGNKASYTSNNNYGICLDASSNNTVTDNTCNNSYSGIYLVSSSNSNTVTGNTCNNNSSYGIYLTYSSNSTVTGNICNNNSNSGIVLSGSSNNTVTGNTCNNNYSRNIYVASSSNNTITGNTCIRGAGLTTDYTASQYTIQLSGTKNHYNLISNNNCMGKAVTSGGGTGNTLVNNKFDEL